MTTFRMFKFTCNSASKVAVNFDVAAAKIRYHNLHIISIDIEVEKIVLVLPFQRVVEDLVPGPK